MNIRMYYYLLLLLIISKSNTNLTIKFLKGVLFADYYCFVCRLLFFILLKKKKEKKKNFLLLMFKRFLIFLSEIKKYCFPFIPYKPNCVAFFFLLSPPCFFFYIIFKKNVSLVLLGKVVGKPVKTLIETITRRGAGGLHVPLPVADVVQPELVSDLSNAHGLREILLVGEHKKNSVAQLVLAEHLVELVVGLDDTLAVVRVNDKDEPLGVLEVVAPQRTDLVLTAHIPHGEVDVLVLNSLHVEPDGGDGRNDLTELQLVEDGGLTGGVEPDHEDSHVLLPEELAEQLSKASTHCCLCCFIFKKKKKLIV